MDNNRFFASAMNCSSAAAFAGTSSEASSWDHSVDKSAQFESALSSMVSSPTSDHPQPPPYYAASAGGFAIRELIGRLGTICNSDDNNNSSCYSTPLNSPPKFNNYQNSGYFGNLTMPVPAAAGSGFAEHAARLSCFNGSGNLSNYRGMLENGKLSRVSSSRSLRGGEVPAKEGNGGARDEEFGSAREESSVSDPESAGENNARKRKVTVAKGKEICSISTPSKDSTKMEEDDKLRTKRCKSTEAADENVNETKAGKKGKENDAKLPETSKQDYIHVRARRGQATDRHSLAERVRREKIGERMKLLQDLVPGCNKIIGKAVMLDEIINYVQSLQRQVEFLSMKLATLNPHLDFNMEGLHPKDMNQACGPVANPMHLLEAADAPHFQYPHQFQQGAPLLAGESMVAKSQCSVNQLEFSLPRALSMQLPTFEGFLGAASQHGAFMESDLQSFVQMGYGQNPEISLSPQNFNGQVPTGQMKIEFS